MGVIDELQASDRLDGRDTYRMLASTFRAAAFQVPLLAPHGAWTADDLDDLFHEFLTNKIEDLTDALVAAATTEAAVVKVAHRIAKYWLIDRVRTETDAGSVRHTLEKVLAADDRFVRSTGLPHYWSLPDEVDVATVPVSTLVAAARAVTDIKTGRPAGETRRASLAPMDDLARVLETVLRAARGAVQIAVLTYVIMERFSVVPIVETPTNDHTAVDRPVALDVTTSVNDATLDVELERALAVLSERERRMLPLLDDLKAIQVALGVGRSQASVLNAKLRAVLTALAPAVQDQETFVDRLMIAARDRGRTISDSVRPSPTDEPSRAGRSSS